MKKILVICCCLLLFVVLSASAQNQYKWRNLEGSVVSSKTKPEWWGQFNKAVDGMIDEAATKQRIAEHDAKQKEREKTLKEKRISGNQSLPDSIKLHGGHFTAMKNAKVPETVTNKLLPLKGKVFTVDEFDAELKKLLPKDEYTVFEEDIKIVAYQETPTIVTEGATPKPTQPSAKTDNCVMKKNYLVAITEEHLNTAMKILRQGDEVALQRMIDAKQVVISGDGAEVFVQRLTLTGKAEIRVKGYTDTVWTLIEAFDCP